jgi:hypothetical protein
VALSRGFPRVDSSTTLPCDVRSFLEGPDRPPRLPDLLHNRSAERALCEELGRRMRDACVLVETLSRRPVCPVGQQSSEPQSQQEPIC